MNLKHEAKVLRHKASKSLMDTSMHDVLLAGVIVTNAFGSGAIFLTSGLDDTETKKTAEIAASYRADLSSLSLEYQQAVTNTTKQLALDSVSDNIGYILMDKNISERDAYDLLQEVGEYIAPIDEVFPYEIGNIGDLRECRASFGDNASLSNVSQCMVEEQEDELMLTNAMAATIISAFLLTFVGTLTKLAAGSKLNEWAGKKPKINKW